MKNNKILVSIIVVLLIIIVFLLTNREKSDIAYDPQYPSPENPSPSPTPSPKPSPSPTPTPNPSPSPSPTPTRTPLSPLDSIYVQYKNGEIAECMYNGNKVYLASQNAYDGGGAVFNTNGALIGPTGYYPVKPQNYINGDDLKNCVDIYVVSPNIWGKAGVNVYNL